MNDAFWFNHRTHRDYLVEHDKPYANMDYEVSFIIGALMGME